eukprot:365584-Chlamydomonas_euryale.AAC.18
MHRTTGAAAAAPAVACPAMQTRGRPAGVCPRPLQAVSVPRRLHVTAMACAASRVQPQPSCSAPLSRQHMRVPATTCRQAPAGTPRQRCDAIPTTSRYAQPVSTSHRQGRGISRLAKSVLPRRLPEVRENILRGACFP